MAIQLNDDEIKDLLQDALKKIESKATQDSKLLSDMNNALNWILSLTTVMFFFYIRANTSNPTGLYQYIFQSNRILFALLISILLLHKIILLRYEKAKGKFIETLQMHCLQLKFDILLLKSKYNFKEMPGIEDFINKLENGSFVSLQENAAFISHPKSIKKFAVIIRVTFWTGLLIFCLYFAGVIIVLGK